ncbi:hypothetical protein CHUAL_000159 [Chamberlinius hualienensis]
MAKKDDWKKTGIAPQGYAIVPADGGWGWLVLVGCYLCGATICFPLVAFSVTMNDIKMVFNANTATVSWSYAALVAMAGLLGPFAAVVASTMSCRKSAILGGFLYSMTLIVSSCATNIGQIIAAFCLIGGLGDALLYVPLASVLSGYFKEHYGVVGGIFMSAFSMAKLVLTPLADYLLEKYGWRGCLLLVGGISFNSCVGAALFQPPKWHFKLKPIEDKKAGLGLDNLSLEVEDDLKLENMTKLAKLQLEMDSEANEIPKAEKDNCQKIVESDLNVTLSDLKHESELRSDVEVTKPSDKSNYESFGQNLKRAMDPKLLKMLNFYMFSLTYTVTFTVAMCSSSYIFSYGLENGLTASQSAWFASVQAIGEMIGRTCGTLIIRVFCFPTIPTFIVSMAASAMSFFALTAVTSVATLYATSCANGLLFGVATGISFSLIVETVGVANIMPAMGYSVLFQGLFQLAMGPFSGWLHDVTGSFVVCYLMYGCLLAAVSLCWLVFYFFSRGHQGKMDTNSAKSN